MAVGTVRGPPRPDRLRYGPGDSVAVTSEPPAPLAGTTWTVTALVSGSVAPSPPAGTNRQAQPTSGKDDSVRGTLGCNQFRGNAAVSGSTLTFGAIGGTKMMCRTPG
ncbi:META domain-containing protein [Streptomyces sp. NPDC058439]|uniref:META domain-containing protein n=1 Tax=Streptomyces sp. NPDC058439 TaxID=3346500 RepID=UPI00364CB752